MCVTHTQTPQKVCMWACPSECISIGTVRWAPPCTLGLTKCSLEHCCSLSVWVRSRDCEVTPRGSASHFSHRFRFQAFHLPICTAQTLLLTTPMLMLVVCSLGTHTLHLFSLSCLPTIPKIRTSNLSFDNGNMKFSTHHGLLTVLWIQIAHPSLARPCYASFLDFPELFQSQFILNRI